MGPLKVSWCQIWTDQLADGLPADKLKGQSLDVLLILWRQLHPKQQYQLMGQGSEGQSSPSEVGRSDNGLLLPQVGRRPRYLGIGVLGAWRPRVELTMSWFPKNEQHVLVVVDNGAESMLIYGNPDCFTGPTACTEGYRDHYIVIHKAQALTSSPV